MQAYIHKLPVTSSPGGFVTAVNVEYRATPKNGTTMMILGNASDDKTGFELSIGTQTVGDRSHVAMLNKLDVAGAKWSRIELRCTVR